jgi:hypothetical protein
VLCTLLAACDLAGPAEVAAPPAVAEDPGPAPVARSQQSLELEQYYTQVQASLQARGLLRTDDGGRDAPYSADDLARNFRQVAFYEEYADLGTDIVQQETESLLHRWQGPVRFQVTFGRAVDMETRARDGRAIAEYIDRLAQATGHPMRLVPEDGNFHVFFVYEDERRALGPELREIIPNLSESAVKVVEDLPRSSYCLVFAWDPKDDGVYTKAIAIIRAEHPDLFRLSCVHEELAQGLGLANDSPLARPSIFNDDEEFALLTSQDALMLRMLFDPRLQPGMSLNEARPIIDQMAQELLGGTS